MAMPALMMQPEVIREKARAAFAEAGWPGRRSEAFRFTPLDNLAGQDWPLAEAASQPEPPVRDGPRLVFDGGQLVEAASDALPEGWQLTSMQEDPAALGWLADRIAADQPAQLALASAPSGWVLELADGADPETCLNLDFVGGQPDHAAPSLLLVRAGAGSRAVLAEQHRSRAGLAQPVIGFDLAAGARLDHAKYQQDSAATRHLGLSVVELAEGSDLASFVLSSGAALARCETQLTLAGPQASARLSALYLGRDSQHHDITTRLKHQAPDCRSEQLIKGVLDGAARGVFQGQIQVAQQAQRTDGQQMSRVLLLSREAEANTKPELEIFADDVACSHGATIGELEADQLFYLMARGISRQMARSLLIAAFIQDALDQIRDPQLACWLAGAAENWRQAE